MNILEITDFSLLTTETNKLILSEINYSVSQGDFIIILGGNGSGKTSLLKSLHKQYEPSSGNIHLMGKSLKHYSHQELHQHVSVLNQQFTDSLFSSLTVYENFVITKSAIKSKTLKAAKKSYLSEYLADFNPNLSHKLDKPINYLSGGEKQALALAFCLLSSPKILLLDEHSSALDPKTAQQIMDLTQKKIKEHSITCLLATHDLDIALNTGNRILMLNDGKLVKAIERDDKLRLNKKDLLNFYSDRNASIGSKLDA